ncbi:MAG: alginate lyase family protein, partial [Alloacidobacterium sp.]
MEAVTRRKFLAIAAATSAHLAVAPAQTGATISSWRLVAEQDHKRILRAASHYLSEQPITVTASRCPRSPGGPHDFYSEGDYWWPDPKDPNGPYIRRDGFTNPQNFNDHREAMVRLSLIVPALTAAWLLTRDKKYAAHASLHLNAWFVDPATRMNPNLEYAQAIFGLNKGRGIGIIDTLHLVEPARAATVLAHAGALKAAPEIQSWF